MRSRVVGVDSIKGSHPVRLSAAAFKVSDRHSASFFPPFNRPNQLPIASFIVVTAHHNIHTKQRNKHGIRLKPRPRGHELGHHGRHHAGDHDAGRQQGADRDCRVRQRKTISFVSHLSRLLSLLPLIPPLPSPPFTHPHLSQRIGTTYYLSR